MESTFVFDPPSSLTIAFTALTAALIGANLMLLRSSATLEDADRWTRLGVAAAVAWLALHAGVAASGRLEGDGWPPPPMVYAVATMAVGGVVAFSPVGRSLAGLPLGLLVGLQAFRWPLEVILHRLFESGDLPVQMTWSGLNYDVVTGVSAAVLGVWSLRRPISRAIVGAWNVMGTTLLLVVVTIAMTSAPTPLRQFVEGPPLVLPFHVPYNWILGVHVWTALVGHLVIFRALRRPQPSATPSDAHA